MHAPLPPIAPGELTPGQMMSLVGKFDPVILDIGANDGANTLGFLRLFPQAKIFAFEPDPRAIAKFKARIKDSRVTLFEMAVGAEDGMAEFHVSSGFPPGTSEKAQAEYPEGWDQSGSLRAPKTHKEAWPWCKFEKTIRVPVRKLDRWAREHGVRNTDFIWADTQGAEADLIAGGKKTLSRTRLFYTEYSNDEYYEGQPNLAEIANMLPDFDIVRRYQMDVLDRKSVV